jgi:hypothetical protein
MKRVIAGVFGLAVLCAPGLVLAQAQGPAGRVIIPFSGSVDLHSFGAELQLGHEDAARSLALVVSMTGQGEYHFRMRVLHPPSPSMDVSATVEGDLRVKGADPRAQEFSGEMKSPDLRINAVHFRGAAVKFGVRERKLVIESVSAGGLSGSGDFELTGKRQMNLNVLAVAADIEEVAMMIRAIHGGKFVMPEIGGLLKGAVNMSGAWPRPYVQGRLSAGNGSVNGFKYDRINLDFEGQYPRVNIKEALVTQADGGLTFRLSGMFDLDDRGNLEGQVARLKKEPLTTAEDDRREWIFRKSSGSDQSSTEMKYWFRKNDRGDTEAVVGIQKSIGF